MRKSRFSEEQIIAILKESEAGWEPNSPQMRREAVLVMQVEVELSQRRACGLMDEQANPAVVQAIMRHSRMDMTLYYARQRDRNALRSTICSADCVSPKYCAAIAAPSNGADDRGQSSKLWCYHELTADLSGSSSAVERQLPKLDVAGSIPVSRSILFRRLKEAPSNAQGTSVADNTITSAFAGSVILCTVLAPFNAKRYAYKLKIRLSFVPSS